MKFKHYYILAVLICFGIGGYTWKISHTGEKLNSTSKPNYPAALPADSVLIYVADHAITSEDIDYEYSLLTAGIFDSEDLTPIPDLGSRFEHELSSVKERLLASIIERKMLYLLVADDSSFDLSDPARYTSCLEEWQKTIALGGRGAGRGPEDTERLKSRLCETSIIKQYLDEKVYPAIEIKDFEIVEYFKNHLNEFRDPEKIMIRQIVLASEADAKKARVGLNRNNFAQRAKDLSITPESEEGGLLGPFKKDDMPRLFDVAFTMTRGSIYGILKSTYGFHLLMLEKKIPKRDLSLEEATPKIKRTLTEKMREAEYKKLVEIASNSIKVRMPKPTW